MKKELCAAFNEEIDRYRIIGQDFNEICFTADKN